ncbi:hypothetical protein ACFWPK_33420 [Nocardia sp. NPDC058519]|uniref:hypothetical protein n=1 Tax=Nocardia sp. NPDC058519 TaxID=3346535 RepID=UPI00365868A8
MEASDLLSELSVVNGLTNIRACRFSVGPPRRGAVRQTFVLRTVEMVEPSPSVAISAQDAAIFHRGDVPGLGGLAVPGLGLEQITNGV